jgi:hypothetical protein
MRNLLSFIRSPMPLSFSTTYSLLMTRSYLLIVGALNEYSSMIFSTRLCNRRAPVFSVLRLISYAV